MLKRILASMAIVSLLLLGVMLVYWWRSNHGHEDQFNLGTASATQSHFLFIKGRIALEVRQNVGGGIQSEMHFYAFKQFIGYFLLLPGLWLAIKIRSLLPRPGFPVDRSNTLKEPK